MYYARLPSWILICLCCVPLCFLTACGGTSTTDTGTKTTGSSGSSTSHAESTSAFHPATQPCPAVVSEPGYWDSILNTQSGVDTVVSVTCANLIGTPSLQALVIVRYEGTGQTTNIYVFNNISSPSPTRIFENDNLYKGDAKISAYNTLLTAEVDQGSKVNAKQSNAGYRQDLFREYKWSNGAGTLVPVSFPGIFPNLTRYEAENSQQQVNQGKLPLLSATQVARSLTTELLNWSTNATVTIVSGGNQHDNDAIVKVTNSGTSGGTINVVMSRLEGNTNNGIWEVTSVTSDGLSVTTPQNRDLLNGATTVTGTANAGSKVKVLDHLYTVLSTTDVKDTNGNTAFSTHVSYTTSFKDGAQEGLLVLYSYSNVDGSIDGAVMLKELLNP